MIFDLNVFCFAIELLCAETIFLYRFHRKKHFFIKLAIILIVILVYSLLFPRIRIENNYLYSFYAFFRYFSIFTLSAIGSYLLFDEKLTTILSAATAGYALQHFTNRFSNLGSLIFPYFDNITNNYLRGFVEIIVFYPIIYFLLGYLFFARKVKNVSDDDNKLNILSIFIVIACMIVTRVGDFIRDNVTYRIAEDLYGMMVTFLAIYIKYSIHYQNEKAKEARLNDMLVKKAEVEYNSWKESIETINIKCHDLKHQLSSLSKTFVSQEDINNIKDSIMIYDSINKTGNPTLDLILFDKAEYCKRNNIKFIYIVDGSILNKLKNNEVFALFTNILDNAIEAVSKVNDIDLRLINLSVKKVGEMVIINEDNYFSGEIKKVNDEIVTIKEDKLNHGFGLKSIKRIVDNNHGIFEVNIDNNLFKINIGLPIE